MFGDFSTMTFPNPAPIAGVPAAPTFSHAKMLETLECISPLYRVGDRLSSVVYDQPDLAAIILPSLHRESIACTQIRVWFLDLIVMQCSVLSQAGNHSNSFQSAGTKRFFNRLQRLSCSLKSLTLSLSIPAR